MQQRVQNHSMKFILQSSLILIIFYTTHVAFCQQYSWTNISSNLPKFSHDTVIINGGADTLIANISGISFLDDNHGWICTYHPFDGEPSAVLETTDGGLTWTEHAAPFAGADIYMIDELNGYFGAVNGFIYKTNDGAQTWTFHGLLMAPLYDLGFPPRPAQNGFAGGKDGHMVQITPEGVFPVDLGLAGSVYCISFPSEERGYAMLDYQMIIYYLNDEWHVEASYPFSSKDWLYFLNDTVGWCVGEMFLKTTVGIDWYRTDPEFVQTGAMMGVYFTDLDHGWAVGVQGQIAYSNDGGNDWTMLEHDLTDQMLMEVLFTSPNNGYIIGGEKTILKYSLVNEMQTATEAGLRIYPNPANETIKISTTQPFNGYLVIYNTSGKQVHYSKLARGVSSCHEINLSFLPPGLYYMEFISNEKVFQGKLIIQD